MQGYSIGGIIYFIIGVFMANSRGYFADLGSILDILSALLAIMLWPLLLFGINLQLSF
jgi:hypothetical protein